MSRAQGLKGTGTVPQVQVTPGHADTGAGGSTRCRGCSTKCQGVQTQGGVGVQHELPEVQRPGSPSRAGARRGCRGAHAVPSPVPPLPPRCRVPSPHPGAGAHTPRSL